MMKCFCGKEGCEDKWHFMLSWKKARLERELADVERLIEAERRIDGQIKPVSSHGLEGIGRVAGSG